MRNIIKVRVAKRDFSVIIEKDENSYFISEVKELPGCHTQAKNRKELMERTKDVIELYLKAKNNKLVGEQHRIAKSGKFMELD